MEKCNGFERMQGEDEECVFEGLKLSKGTCSLRKNLFFFFFLKEK